MSKIEELFYRLNGVASYCVFKEMDLIEKTISGEEDIDILIEEHDMKKAQEIMIELGYR